MPATNVPCPRPSPGEFGVRVVKFTCVSTRPPKSATCVASTPESTTAMVGAVRPLDQNALAPWTFVHTCAFEKLPAVRTAVSGTIDWIPESASSSASWSPVNVPDSALRTTYFFLILAFVDGFFDIAVLTLFSTDEEEVAAVPVTMTPNVPVGFALIASRRPFRIRAPFAGEAKPRCARTETTSARSPSFRRSDLPPQRVFRRALAGLPTPRPRSLTASIVSLSQRPGGRVAAVPQKVDPCCTVRGRRGTLMPLLGQWRSNHLTGG